jgi:hypothetical protein
MLSTDGARLTGAAASTAINHTADMTAANLVNHAHDPFQNPKSLNFIVPPAVPRDCMASSSDFPPLEKKGPQPPEISASIRRDVPVPRDGTGT